MVRCADVTTNSPIYVYLYSVFFILFYIYIKVGTQGTEANIVQSKRAFVLPPGGSQRGHGVNTHTAGCISGFETGHGV